MKDNITTDNLLEKKIYTIRGIQVMFDRDLSELYGGVETKRLNEQVKRNIDRFPKDFMFQLTSLELENWKSQFATSNKEFLGLRKMPYVFSEQGVSMLSAVLKSKMAVNTSINIIKAFVQMRKIISSNNLFDKRLDILEYKQFKTDAKIETILNVIEQKSTKPNQGIFYDGQVFDAHNFVSDLIRDAKENIILIDNFIDDSVLTLFSKNENIDITIYTKTITKQLKLDLEKYNSQYKKIDIKIFKASHDRFLIIDNLNIYHIGASLKDLGKKWFAFSKFDINSFNLLDKLNNK